MIKELIDYFKKYIDISEEIEQKINVISLRKDLAKGEIVLMDNSIKKEHVFVVNGCLRSFLKSEDGKEHTVQFAVKNWWISDYTTLYSDKKSMLSIESLTKSTVLIINKDKMRAITNEYSVFKSFTDDKFTRRIASLEKRILSLLTLTATERYLRFIEEYSVFEQIIPNYQIASYLGITPQSLSRIRNKMTIKNH